MAKNMEHYKALKIFQRNMKNYSAKKMQQYEELKSLGLNIRHFWLDKDFDLERQLMDNSIFKTGDAQDFAMPYTDSSLKTFRDMTKKPVGNPFMFEHKDKLVHGTYLLGEHNSHDVLFAFSIVRDKKERKNYQNFSIKLDMCVNGATWLPLLRLDSSGEPHANLIVNNQVVDTVDDIQYVEAPHIHLATERSQVICDTLSYSPAFTPKELGIRLNPESETYFQDALKGTMKLCGISSRYMSKDNPDKLADHRHYIFDYPTM